MQLRKTQIFASILLASSIMFAPIAVNAANHSQQSTMHSHHAKFQKNGYKHMSKLDLSQEQKDQIFKIRHDQQAAVYEQKKLINAAKKELSAASSGDKLDADKAKKAAADLGQAKGQLALLKAQSRVDFMAVLTPEQKQKMAERKTKRADKK